MGLLSTVKEALIGEGFDVLISVNSMLKGIIIFLILFSAFKMASAIKKNTDINYMWAFGAYGVYLFTVTSDYKLIIVAELIFIAINLVTKHKIIFLAVFLFNSIKLYNNQVALKTKKDFQDYNVDDVRNTLK